MKCLIKKQQYVARYKRELYKNCETTDYWKYAYYSLIVSLTFLSHVWRDYHLLVIQMEGSFEKMVIQTSKRSSSHWVEDIWAIA